MIIGGVHPAEEDYFQVSKAPITAFLFAGLFIAQPLFTVVKMPKESSKNLAMHRFRLASLFHHLNLSLFWLLKFTLLL